jgi:hypothetical protein
VHVVSSHERPLEFIQDEFEDVNVRALRVIFALVYLEGNETKITSNQLGNRRRLVILG